MTGAYLARGAAYHAALGDLVPLPIDHLVVLAIGRPAAATAGGWLLAGREPASFSRHARD